MTSDLAISLKTSSSPSIIAPLVWTSLIDAYEALRNAHEDRDRDTYLKQKSRCRPWQSSMSRIVLHNGIANTLDFLNPGDRLSENITNNDEFSFSVLPFPLLFLRGALGFSCQYKHILQGLESICRRACLSYDNLVGRLECLQSFAPKIIIRSEWSVNHIIRYRMGFGVGRSIQEKEALKAYRLLSVLRAFMWTFSWDAILYLAVFQQKSYPGILESICEA